jgi:hypothetical protein
MRQINAFYNERTDTLNLDLDGHVFTLNAKDAWRLLDAIELSLAGPSLVADHKGD